MAKKSSPKKRTTRRKKPKRPGLLVRLRRFVLRVLLLGLALVLLWVLAYRYIAPPITPYIWSERQRLGAVERIWVPLDEINPVMARAAVAAEDANFCLHWGFDVDALRDAIADGGQRGASTISQQVVKNVFLWHGRTYTRKGLEAVLTPVVEALWPKSRIIEVYLNVAEFDEGVFGVEAAARHYFRTSAADLSPTQAARLAAILPAPKSRSASNPSPFVRARTSQIMAGAETIRVDGRSDCLVR